MGVGSNPASTTPWLCDAGQPLNLSESAPLCNRGRAGDARGGHRLTWRPSARTLTQSSLSPSVSAETV